MGALLIAGLLLQIVLLSSLDAGEATADARHARPKSFLKASDSSILKTSESRPKTKLFIGLPSDRRRRHHRNAARETWMQLAAKTDQVVTRFFVSHDGKDANMTGELQLEHEEHEDMVILGPGYLGPDKEVLDGIPGVTQKMFFLFEMAVTAFEPEYVARIDDDSYVNIPVIMHMLARNLSDRPFWYGFTIHGAQIDHRESDGLSLLKYQSYVDDLIHPPIVPQYMNGALVIISANAVEAMVAINNIVGLRMLWDDDVAIGLWLGGFDMKTLSPEEAGCIVRPYRPREFGLIEWDDAPMDNFCLDAPLPYALVHPCKDPNIIRRVYETAMDCKDPIAPGMPDSAR